MGGFTARERFLGTLLGQEVDRFPYFDLEPSEDTLKRWRTEGLPANRSVADFFALETHQNIGVTVRSHPYFKGAPELLTDPSAFERHYDLDHPGRFQEGWEERCREARNRGRVVYVDARAGGMLQMLGVHNWDSLMAAAVALIEEPRKVERLIGRTVDFHCACLERVLRRVSVDYATFYEPIASNRGPVVSPAHFKRFALPGIREVLKLLERYGVPLRIFSTTGGDLRPLLPCLLDAGINGLWISNVYSARMAYRELRRAFGREVSLIGGVDATCLTQGESAVRSAVREVVPGLLEQGRYLPCLDDRPRSNVPFRLYRCYREHLDAIAGQGCS